MTRTRSRNVNFVYMTWSRNSLVNEMPPLGGEKEDASDASDD